MKTILVILLCLTSPCLAYVGATFAECKVKYGKCQSKDARTGEAMFDAEGLLVRVTFAKGAAVMVEYQKKDRTELASAQIMAALIFSGKDWTPMKSGKNYQTPDGRVLAGYTERNVLIITLADYMAEIGNKTKP